MQPDPALCAAQTPGAPRVVTDLDRLGVKIVLCDEAGRPRTGRILDLSACLGDFPPTSCSPA